MSQLWSTQTSRKELNQALAKALAYADCAKYEQAQAWGEVLIRKLELAGVFKAGRVRVTEPVTQWLTGGAK